MAESFLEKFLSYFLNVAPHEWGRVLVSFFIKTITQIVFIASSTILIAIFVEHFNGVSKLPFLYIFQSILAITSVIFLIEKKSEKGSPEKTIAVLSVLTAIGLFFAAIFSDFLILFFVTLVATISILLRQISIRVNIFIEELFSPLSSERVFPIIESSEPIGGILAGFLILLLLHFLEPTKMLLVLGFLILTILPFLFFAFRNFKEIPILKTEEEEISEKRFDRIVKNFQLFRHMPFLTGLFLVIFLQYFSVHLLEFQFTKALDANISHSVSAESHSHSEQLTHGIGTIHILISGFLLFFQIFFASRIIRKIGTMFTFSLNSIFSFFAFLPMFFGLNIFSAVLAKGVFEVTTGVGKNAFASIFYSMRENLRNRAKEILEGIAIPLGIFFGTLVLLLLQFFFHEENLTSMVSLSLIFISSLSVFFILKIRHHYTLFSRKNLHSSGKNIDEKINAIEILSQPGHYHATDFLLQALYSKREIPEIKIKILKTLGKRQDLQSIPAILDAITDENQEIKIAALEALVKFKNLGKHFFSQSFSQFRIRSILKKLFLEKSSKEMKILAIRVFANLKDKEIIPFLIEILENKKDPTLLSESILVCGMFHDSSSIPYLEPFLNHENLKVKSAAIIALWQFVAMRLKLTLIISSMIESKEEKELIAGISIIGEVRALQEKDQIEKFLNSTNEEIKRQAAIALAKMENEKSLDHLFEFIFHSEKEVGKKTKQHLEKIPKNFRLHLEKRTHQEVSRKTTLILKSEKAKNLEELSEKSLKELLHLFELSSSENHIIKIRMILKDKNKTVKL